MAFLLYSILFFHLTRQQSWAAPRISTPPPTVARKRHALAFNKSKTCKSLAIAHPKNKLEASVFLAFLPTYSRKNPGDPDLYKCYKIALESGANPTETASLEPRFEPGVAPLQGVPANLPDYDKIIQLLLNAGADPNESLKNLNPSMPPPIDAIVQNAELETIKLARAKGARFTGQNLFDAANQTDVNLLKYLLEEGAPIDAKSPNSGRTVLQIALNAATENVDSTDINSIEAIVQILLQKGADCMATDLEGNSALHYAAAGPLSAKVTKQLMSKGLGNNPNLRGETPLHIALGSPFAENNRKTIELLIKSDPDLSRKTLTGKNYLHAASRFQTDAHLFDALKKGGANLNEKEANGKTPIYDAIASQNLDAVKWLLSNGAELGVIDAQGLSPYELSLMSSGSTEIANYIGIALHKKIWRNWTPALPEKQLLDALIFFMTRELPFPPLPKKAPEKTKLAYEFLKASKASPWTLTASALELDDMPIEYYSSILKAARTPEARAANKFHPTPAQARKILKSGITDKDGKNADFELMGWLIARSKMDLDIEVLNQFNFDSEILKKDVANMLESDALRYLGNSTLAAIKLIKALEGYPNSEFACEEDSEISNTRVSDILIWFGAYGNNPDADRQFFAKLARYILAKKPVCSQYRNLMLKAMNDWKVANAPVQGEIVYAIDQAFHEMPATFSEVLMLAHSVGMKSELSQAAWLEQLAAYASLRARDNDKAPTETEAEIARGLLKTILGSPQGKLKFESASIVIPKAEGKKGFIERICRIGRDKPELKVWMKEIQAQLSQPRSWPKGFEADSPAASSLEEEFANAGLQADLEAIKSECASVAAKTSRSLTVPPKPIAQPSPSPRRGDFDPRPKSKRK